MVLARESTRSEKDYESDLNKAQLENNFALRSLISFDDQTQRYHFLVLQETKGDKLYIVNKFNATVQDLFKTFTTAKANAKTTPGFNEEVEKSALLTKISQNLHQ